MVVWWLVLVAVIISLLVLGVCTYIVVLYQSEFDRGRAWFPRIVCIFSLTLACVTVLLLPLDVANRKDPTIAESTGGGLNLELAWQIILWTVAAMIIIVIPFTTFYYEAWDPDDDNPAAQVPPALLGTFIVAVIFGLICGLVWYYYGYALIPYKAYTGVPQAVHPFDPALRYYNQKSDEILEVQVSLFVYVVGLLCFFGWFLFAVYAGVGLVALPELLYIDVASRPRPLSLSELNAAKAQIAAKASILLREGETLKRGVVRQYAQEEVNRGWVSSMFRAIEKPLASLRRSTVSRAQVNKFRKRVLRLERKFERAVQGFEDRGFGPFKIAALSILTFIAGCISVLWVLHMILYNIPKEFANEEISPFLNIMLIELDQAFSLLGTLAYAMFGFYLLWATVKGCFKIGFRLVIFQIHPMKVGDTIMSSLLFNCGLVLICSIVVTQFCAMSFDLYATSTTIDGLLNTYVRHLKGIGGVFFYIQLVLLGITCLTLFIGVCCAGYKLRERRKKGRRLGSSDDDDDASTSEEDAGGCCC
jgi:LMBR1 domain-containing protein 1